MIKTLLSEETMFDAREGEIVVVLDSQLKYLYLNDAACQSLNRNKEELLGKRITDIYPEVLGSPNHKNLKVALEGNHVHATIDSPGGIKIDVDYKPIFARGKVIYLLIKAKYLDA